MSTDNPFYNFDEGRYHFQSLLWTKEYRIIPGLANLHDRLGTNSSWYLFNSLFDVFYFQKKVFHIINPLVFLYLIIYVSFNSFKLIKRINLLSIASILFLLYFIYDFSFIRFWYFIGVTPDAGVNFFILAALFILIELIQNPLSIHAKSNIVLLVIAASSAFMCRISGILSFLTLSFCLLTIYNNFKYKGGFLKLAAIPFSVFIIVFFRNYYLSGYILFPALKNSWFPPDWEFPNHYAKQFLNYASNHAIYEHIGKIKEYSSTFCRQRVVDLFDFFVANNVSQLGYFSIYIITFGLLPIFLAIRQKEKPRLLFSFLICIIISVVAYVFTGGVYRFGLGYVWLCSILPLTLFSQVIIEKAKGLKRNFRGLKSREMIATTIMLLLIARIILFTSPVSLRQTRLKYPFLLAKEYSLNFISLSQCPKFSTEILTVDNKKINISNYYLNYKTRLPSDFFVKDENCSVMVNELAYNGYPTCLEYNAFVAKMNWMHPLPSVGAIYKGLEFRGDNIEDGFRLKGVYLENQN